MNQKQTSQTDPFSFAFNPQSVQQTISNPIIQSFGAQIGYKVLNFTSNYDSFLHRVFSSEYRYYFDVDNKYVLKKLLVLLAPYIYTVLQIFISSLSRENGLIKLKKQISIVWTWMINQTQKMRIQWFQQSMLVILHPSKLKFTTILQRNNMHSPDLYVPLMSLITFILICSFSLGINENSKNFDPNVIGSSLWKCIVVSILELTIFKIVFCFLEGNRIGTFDLVSHLNYRYVSLCLLMIMRIIENGPITMILSIYLFFCQGFFVYKTLQRYSSQQMIQNALELNAFGQKIIGILAGIQPAFSWLLLKIIGSY